LMLNKLKASEAKLGLGPSSRQHLVAFCGKYVPKQQVQADAQTLPVIEAYLKALHERYMTDQLATIRVDFCTLLVFLPAPQPVATGEN